MVVAAVWGHNLKSSAIGHRGHPRNPLGFLTLSDVEHLIITIFEIQGKTPFRQSSLNNYEKV